MLYFGYTRLKTYSKIDGDNLVQFSYFDGRLSSTAILSDYPTWDEGTNYAYKQKVYIPELKRVFISKVSDNIGLTPWDNPNQWWGEGSNDVLSLDQIESSMSVHTQGQDAVEVFSLKGYSHLVGTRIKGAKRVHIFYRKHDDDEWEESITFNLKQFVGFKGCSTCCDVIYYNSDRYVVRVDKDMCVDTAQVKVVLEREEDDGVITIGTQTAVFAYELGCIDDTEFGVNVPKSYTLWENGEKIEKTINYLERYISGSVVTSEVRMWENFKFLSDNLFRKHFFWIEHSEIEEDGFNKYENSLVFGSMDGISQKAREFSHESNSFKISGVEK